MKLRAAALSIVSVLATVAATPAMAQYWYAPGPYAAGPYADPYGGPRPYYARGSYGYEGISPYEVGAIVRSANLQPISRPWRNGANFVVRAINLRGGTVRVVIDGYRGRILAITPAEMAPTARLAPDPRRDGTQFDEDGNVLPPRPVPNAQRPVTEQQRPAVEHKRTAAVTPVHPPLPRPRPADAPSPVVAVKPAPDTPAAPAAATPPPAPETVPQPTETPAGATGSTTGAAPSAGSGASFPPVTPLE